MPTILQISFCLITILQIASYCSSNVTGKEGGDVYENGEVGLDGVLTETESETVPATAPTTETQNLQPAAAAAAANEKCGLYMAESSIPGAGSGIYTAVDVKNGDLVSYPDICILFLDMVKSLITDDYSWSPSDFGAEFEAISVTPLCPGLGALTNCHMGLNNAGNGILTYDSGGLHRSTHPGAGAITYYHDLRTAALEDIPAGSEIFVDYGEEWFNSRETKLGKLPMLWDFAMAEHVTEAIKLYMDEHGYETTEESKKYVMELVRNILDTDYTSKLIPLLPKTLDEANAVIEGGSARHSLPESIRSLEWLETNGHCIDNIKAGPSTHPGAGRGAFATRNIPKGSAISVSHLLLLHKEDLDMTSGDGKKTKQLGLNYCFGHPRSTLLFLPYAPIVSLINHDSKSPNAEVRWFHEGGDVDNDKWLKQEFTDDMLESHKVNFMIQYIAKRDIKPGEEVFIDYGKEWEDTWAKHVEQWIPALNAKDYMLPSAFMGLNADEPIRTGDEQRETPYPDNILTACYYHYLPQEEYFDSDSLEVDEEGYTIVVDEWLEEEGLFTFHHYLRPCSIMSREDDPDTNVDYTYTAQMFNVPDVTSDPDSVIPDSEKRFVTGIPRKAITFVEIPYMGDQHLMPAFRQPIGIPDSMFPHSWKNI